jgi:RHS repeat-associated protein
MYYGANSIEEVDQNGNLLARYTQGAGIDEALAELRSGTVSYYEQDGLGSVTSLSSGTGALANTYVYDGFGNLTASTGNLTNPFQYTGRDYDPETGLRYYRARYYDPSTGRFLSEDPIGFDGDGNLYAYAGDNPASWIDPDGLRRAQVCHRPLDVPILGHIFNHTFIQFLNDNGTIDSYGILGNPGSSKNQIPRHGNGTVEDPRPGDKGPVKDRNHSNNPQKAFKDIPLTPCQLDQLQQNLQDAVEAGTCPSCGDNYRRWFVTDLAHPFDGFK